MATGPQSAAAPAGNVIALPVGATHNNYSLYVLEPADLVGLIAYSLYKQHKIKFLEEELKKTGQPATNTNIDMFCFLYGQPHQVALLRMEAHKLLSSLNDRLLANQIKLLRKEYKKDLIRQLKEGGGIWKATWYSVVGNIATAALIALIVWGNSANFDQVLAAIKRPFTKTDATQQEPVGEAPSLPNK